MAGWRGNVVARTRWAFVLLAGVPLAVELGRADRQMLDWLLGMITGGVIAMWVALTDAPPWYIEKWRWGAEGERFTAKVLAPLRRNGWVLIHDVPAVRGNRDHVVFGPGGAFLLDTKRLMGSVSVEGDIVRVERTHDPDEHCEWPRIAAQVRGLAVGMKRELDAGGVHVGWVRAVVVLWGEFPQRVVEGDRVTFVHGDELAGWLAWQSARRPFDAARAAEVLLRQGQHVRAS